MLVSNADYELAQIGQLYRDRADCENGFDEIKNQWGWGASPRLDLRSTHPAVGPLSRLPRIRLTEVRAPSSSDHA